MLELLSKATVTGGLLNLDPLSPEECKDLKSKANETLVGLIDGFHAIGSMMIWESLEDETHADEYALNVGTLLRIMADLADTCVTAEGADSMRDLLAEERRLKAAQ